MAEAWRPSARIVVRGAEPWRFADRCTREGIALHGVVLTDEITLQAAIPLGRLERAGRLAEHCGCSLEILSVSALPRTAARIRHRRVLLAAFALMTAALLVSSLFVWEIRVTQNDSDIPDAQILRVLASQGVGVGSFWPSFRAERIRTRALLSLPELRFLTVNVRACRASVEVRAAVPPPEIFDPDEPGTITARRTGVIHSMTVLSGEPQVSRGDAVTAGQTLIAGTAAFPHAQGRVFAFTCRELTASAPLFAYRKTEPARRQRRFAVVFGSKRLNFYRNGGIPPAEYDKITQVWTLEAKNLFSFPLRWICETITARGAERVELSEEEVKQALAASLSDRLHERLGTDGQVLSEHWSSAADGGWLRLTLRSECLERIDEESPGERPQRYQ